MDEERQSLNETRDRGTRPVAPPGNPWNGRLSITITLAFATSIPTSMTVVVTSTSISPARKERMTASLAAAAS